VSSLQVDAALRPLQRCPRVVSLDPRRLDDVFADILTIGAALGRDGEAVRLVDLLRGRLAQIRARSAQRGSRPRVAALEWLDPPFAGGHWVPEMIDLAGGDDVFGRPGDASRRLTWRELEAADPDWIVTMPCGFDEAGAHEQAAAVAPRPELRALRAVREGRVAAVDANGCFSRPGPRLVDGIERLAAILGEAATRLGG
jgi:iron complex transport system substrate-binding protein